MIMSKIALVVDYTTPQDLKITEALVRNNSCLEWGPYIYRTQRNCVFIIRSATINMAYPSRVTWLFFTQGRRPVCHGNPSRIHNVTMLNHLQPSNLNNKSIGGEPMARKPYGSELTYDQHSPCLHSTDGSRSCEVCPESQPPRTARSRRCSATIPVTYIQHAYALKFHHFVTYDTYAKIRNRNHTIAALQFDAAPSATSRLT